MFVMLESSILCKFVMNTECHVSFIYDTLLICKIQQGNGGYLKISVVIDRGQCWGCFCINNKMGTSPKKIITDVFIFKIVKQDLEMLVLLKVQYLSFPGINRKCNGPTITFIAFAQKI